MARRSLPILYIIVLAQAQLYPSQAEMGIQLTTSTL